MSNLVALTYCQADRPCFQVRPCKDGTLLFGRRVSAESMSASDQFVQTLNEPTTNNNLPPHHQPLSTPPPTTLHPTTNHSPPHHQPPSTPPPTTLHPTTNHPPPHHQQPSTPLPTTLHSTTNNPPPHHQPPSTPPPTTLHPTTNHPPPHHQPPSTPPPSYPPTPGPLKWTRTMDMSAVQIVLTCDIDINLREMHYCHLPTTWKGHSRNPWVDI